MGTLFDPADRDSILERLAKLQPDATRQWGKMTCAQALAHCTVALEAGTGDKPRKQQLIGKVFAPFVRKSLLGEKPFSRNSPTDPTFVVTDDRDFEAERQRLTGVIKRFCELGPQNASTQAHSFFGRMSGEEWGLLMYKHLDHHLRQFGA
jgi:hypothetical protein